jgi:hypothetical protein
MLSKAFFDDRPCFGFDGSSDDRSLFQRLGLSVCEAPILSTDCA